MIKKLTPTNFFSSDILADQLKQSWKWLKKLTKDHVSNTKSVKKFEAQQN